jgi:hypothetical protein
MITFRDLFIFSGSVALLAFKAVAGQPGQLSFRISPTEVQPGERVFVEIRLPKAFPKGAEHGEISEDLEPAINDSYLVSSKNYQLLNKDFKKEKEDFVWTYEMTAYTPGQIAISPVEIQYGPYSLSTERSVVKVGNTRAENDGALREEFDRVRAPLDWRRLFKWVFLAAMAGALAACAAVYLPRWKRKPVVAKIADPVPEPKENDLDWLRRRLQDLRNRIDSKPLGDGDEAFVDEITMILREFFGRKLEFPVPMLTTGELARRFSSDPGVSKVLPIFEQCDSFKFAKNRSLSAKVITMRAIGDAEGVISLYV